MWCVKRQASQSLDLWLHLVIKKQEYEPPKERRKRRTRNRLVYNDGNLYGFVQMLKYKCLHVGKELYMTSAAIKYTYICFERQQLAWN